MCVKKKDNFQNNPIYYIIFRFKNSEPRIPYLNKGATKVKCTYDSV